MCNKDGQTYVNWLTPGPAGTETSAQYQVGLTHYTCDGMEMCVNNGEGWPLASALSVQVIGGPNLIPNSNQYCCDVRIICDVTYQQICGCRCRQNKCLITEKVVATVCVPCGDTLPTIANEGVTAQAANVQCGCSTTNEMSLNVAFTLETAAEAEETDGEG